MTDDYAYIPKIRHTKFPEAVMVLVIVINEGLIMTPHFFLRGLRVNAAILQEVLQRVVTAYATEDDMSSNKTLHHLRQSKHGFMTISMVSQKHDHLVES